MQSAHDRVLRGERVEQKVAKTQRKEIDKNGIDEKTTGADLPKNESPASDQRMRSAFLGSLTIS